MTIKRTVNGIEMEFELTGIELYNAFCEQEHSFDKSDIDCYFDRENYNLSEAEVDSLIDEMACCMRRYIDKYDCDFSYARDEAIRDVLRSHNMEVED